MCVCNRKGKYMKHSTSKVMELEPHLVGDVFFWRFTSWIPNGGGIRRSQLIFVTGGFSPSRWLQVWVLIEEKGCKGKSKIVNRNAPV